MSEEGSGLLAFPVTPRGFSSLSHERDAVLCSERGCSWIRQVRFADGGFGFAG